MATHVFSDSLEYEQSKFETNNRFYTEKLEAISIERIKFEGKEGKTLQRNDIDLYVTLEGKRISVSEKDRHKNFHDVLIEFYSKYPAVRGWMDHSKADILAYFVPGSVFWINKVQLVWFYENLLKSVVADTFFDELIRSRKTIGTKEIILLGKKETITLVAAYNREYITASVCVGLDVLKRAGVEYRIYIFH